MKAATTIETRDKNEIQFYFKAWLTNSVFDAKGFPMRARSIHIDNTGFCTVYCEEI